MKLIMSSPYVYFQPMDSLNSITIHNFWLNTKHYVQTSRNGSKQYSHLETACLFLHQIVMVRRWANLARSWIELSLVAAVVLNGLQPLCSFRSGCVLGVGVRGTVLFSESCSTLNFSRTCPLVPPRMSFSMLLPLPQLLLGKSIIEAERVLSCSNPDQSLGSAVCLGLRGGLSQDSCPSSLWWSTSACIWS